MLDILFIFSSMLLIVSFYVSLEAAFCVKYYTKKIDQAPSTYLRVQLIASRSFARRRLQISLWVGIALALTSLVTSQLMYPLI